MPEMRLEELARHIGARLEGHPQADRVTVTGCAALDAAQPGQVSFLSNPRYADQLTSCRASAVIVSPADAHRLADAVALVADDPYLAFRRAMVSLHGFRPAPPAGVSASAHVDPDARLGEGCTVGPGACVAAGARVGQRSVLYPNVYIGQDAVVGDDCVLHPGVCVYDGCVLGDRVTLHANTVIGQDGFGYATAPADQTPTSHSPPSDGSAAANTGEVVHHKIPQAGNAVVGDDVEMGANCSVDRAAVGSTVIGGGSKFSDNVVVGHGVRIGRHCLLVAHVGIAGSTTLGDYVSVGGQAGIAGHLRIGDRVRIAADAKVMHDIPDGQEWGGTPAVPLTRAKRAILHQQRLPDLADRVQALETQLRRLSDRR